MIRIISIAILVLHALSAFSQSQPQYRLHHVKREQLNINTNWATIDSAYYFYSGDNPGAVTWEWAESLSRISTPALYELLHFNLCYDSMYTTQNIQGSAIKTKTASQDIDPLHRITKQEKYYKHLITGVFTLTQTQTCTYSGNDLVETVSGSIKYVYKYANGLLDSMWRYTGSNLNNVTVYSYNASGLLLKSAMYFAPADSMVTTYTYDANNRLAENMRYGAYNPPQYDTISILKYTYNSAGDVQTEELWQSMWNNLGRWEKFENTYDASHKKLEQIWSVGTATGWDLFGKRIFTYNSNSQLTKLELQRWDGSQWTYGVDTAVSGYRSSHILTFDYETYWPVNIAETEAGTTQVKLYPSPASDFIRVEAEWKQALPFTAAIYDMHGRLVRQWQEPAAKIYTRTIPLTELPGGNYVLKMQCGEEQAVKQFMILKQ